MSRSGKKPHIYYPSSVSELLSIKKAHPRSVICSGGTYLMSRFSDAELTGEIISLRDINDFSRLNRSESSLEIGPCVTLSQLLPLKRYLGMKALFEAINSIGSVPVKAVATLGGNLGLRARTVNLLPVLYLLETRIEVRHAGGSSWVPIKKYYESEKATGTESAITRIRIPLVHRNFERYELLKEHIGLEPDAMSFYCLADVHKDGILTSFNCSLCHAGSGIVRNKDMEALIEGKKLPLSRKDINRAVESMEETLENLEIPLYPVQRKSQTLSLLENTLQIMGEE